MEQLAWEIAETAHALRRAFDRRAAELGVTRAQWRVMAHLGRTPGLRQVELAERMDIEPITLCRIVDRLEESALVERRRDPIDRRAWQLFLTVKAEPVVEQLHKVAAKMADEAFEGLEPASIQSVRTALSQIRTNLSEAAKARVSA